MPDNFWNTEIPGRTKSGKRKAKKRKRRTSRAQVASRPKTEKPDRNTQGACSDTADAALKACLYQAEADYWLAIGKCENASSSSKRNSCVDQAEKHRVDAKELCAAQHEARLELCNELGEGPYDPVIEPDNFVSRVTNPFFPLVPGRTKIFRSEEETVAVTVTDKTKEILGVETTVVRDTVTEDGQVVEDTEDYYAQDKQGNVWYFGELSKTFEDGELVSLEGSWMAGVNGAKPGIVMEANPQVGDVYRQEFLLGEAEDAARVISLTGSATVPAASCDNCFVTEDFTPLEPDVVETKYYARGIGVILEVEKEGRLELVEIRNP